MLIKRKKGIFCKKIYEEFSSSWEKFLFLKIVSILQASILKKKKFKITLITGKCLKKFWKKIYKLAF